VDYRLSMTFGISRDELVALPSTFSLLFDSCHFLLAALAVRKEFGLGYSRSKPLATWLATMTASFAGSMIANPLLGKPILAALSSEFNIFLASVIWWGVCYSPGDVVYNLATNKVVYMPVCVVKEIYRAKKTLGGVLDAKKVFPDHELAMVMIGAIKGNGSGFMKPITRLVCGQWKPTSTEVLEMSVTTKECLLAAFLLVLDQGGLVPPPLSGDLLYISIVSGFLFIKLSSILAQPLDPFAPVESLISSLTLGGLWDAEGDQIAAKEKEVEEEVEPEEEKEKEE